MIFDFHGHIGISKVYGGRDCNPQMVIDHMDRCGVDKCVLLPTASCCPIYPWQHVVKAVEQFPDRFVGFMLVNPREPNAMEILEEGIIVHKLRGVKLHPTFWAFAADDEQLVYPIVRRAGELGVPVMIHTGPQYPYSTPWQVGLAAMDNPGTTIVMAHMGLDELVLCEAAIKMAKRAPNLILETTGVSTEHMITRAVEEIGHERVVYGSDLPNHDSRWEILKVQTCKISDEAKAAILGGNAMRMFGLK